MTTPPPKAGSTLQKQISMGLAAIGVIAMAAMGYLSIDTPQGAQCAIDLADARARLELLTEVRDQCKVALKSCNGRTDDP